MSNLLLCFLGNLPNNWKDFFDCNETIKENIAIIYHPIDFDENNMMYDVC